MEQHAQHLQCLNKLIKCFVLLHCFKYISLMNKCEIFSLGLFESPEL